MTEDRRRVKRKENKEEMKYLFSIRFFKVRVPWKDGVETEIVGSVQKKICEAPRIMKIVSGFEGLNLAQDLGSRSLLVLLLWPHTVLTSGI